MNNKPIFKSPAAKQLIMDVYDDLLRNWSAPYETMEVPTRHGSTFVIACGAPDAPPLVLLHGAGTNSAVWAADAARYCQQHRVYAVDLLGEPGRSAPNRPAWDSPAYAEWLSDVLDALEVRQAALVGISQGGWTALKFALSYPERVTMMALLCPGGIVRDNLSFVLKTIPLSLIGQWGMKQVNRMLFGSQPVPDGVEEITALMMRNFNARYGVLPIYTDAELQRLTMPVLLLGGDEDALRDTHKIADRIRTHMPQAKITIMKGGGHALLDTVDHVTDFLAMAVPTA